MKSVVELENDERAQHHRPGVREVDDLHHPVHERQSKGHQRVQAGRQDRGYDEPCDRRGLVHLAGAGHGQHRCLRTLEAAWPDNRDLVVGQVLGHQEGRLRLARLVEADLVARHERARELETGERIAHLGAIQ